MFNAALTGKLLTLPGADRDYVISKVQVFQPDLYERLQHANVDVLTDEVLFEKDVHIMLLHDGNMSEGFTGSHFGLMLILGLNTLAMRSPRVVFFFSFQFILCFLPTYFICLFICLCIFYMN